MVPKKTSYFGVFNPNNGSWTGVRGQLQRRVWRIAIAVVLYTFLNLVKSTNQLTTVLSFIETTFSRGEIQEVDLVCSAFSGIYDRGVTELAAYAGSDMYGMLIQYPNPYSSIYGHIMIFSPKVLYFILVTS